MGRHIGKEPANSVPGWHTAALVALIVSVAVVGWALGPNGVPPPPREPRSRILSVYLPLLCVNWGLLAYVCRVGRKRNALRSLLGTLPANATGALADVTLGAAFLLVLAAAEFAAQRALGSGQSAAVASVLPRTFSERMAWCALAVGVGFCEEVVYRGYLQTRLAALTGRAWLGVLLQAVLFGMAHGDQGAGTALRVLAYGVGFGLLAQWRRSLVPGILAHVAVDLAVGLLR